MCHRSLSSLQCRGVTFEDAYDETRGDSQTFLHKVADHDCYVFLPMELGWHTTSLRSRLVAAIRTTLLATARAAGPSGLLPRWTVSRLRAAHGCCAALLRSPCCGFHVSSSHKDVAANSFFGCAPVQMFRTLSKIGVCSANCNGKLTDA